MKKYFTKSNIAIFVLGIVTYFVISTIITLIK